jgi:hypothetical protein
MSRDGAVVAGPDDDSWHRGGARNVVLCHLTARRFAFVGMERSMFVYVVSGLRAAGFIGNEARGLDSLLLSLCIVSATG